MREELQYQGRTGQSWWATTLRMPLWIVKALEAMKRISLDLCND